MEEEKRENMSAEEQAQQAMMQEAEKAQKALSDAKEDMIRTIYKSIDYRNLFSMVGQPDRYQDFMDYVQEYEKSVKSEDNQEIPEPKLWHEFLDNTAIDAKTIGLMWDYIISFVINVSIGSSQLIVGTVYDNVIVPQFERVQEFNENIAHTIGNLAKIVDDLEKRVNSMNK